MLIICFCPWHLASGQIIALVLYIQGHFRQHGGKYLRGTKTLALILLLVEHGVTSVCSRYMVLIAQSQSQEVL